MLYKLIGAGMVAGAYVMGCVLLGRGISTPDDDELEAEYRDRLAHARLDKLAREAQWQTDLRWTGQCR